MRPRIGGFDGLCFDLFSFREDEGFVGVKVCGGLVRICFPLGPFPLEVSDPCWLEELAAGLDGGGPPTKGALIIKSNTNSKIICVNSYYPNETIHDEYFKGYTSPIAHSSSQLFS